MTLFSFLALLPSFIIGFSIVSLCWNDGLFHHVMIKSILGIGAGIGITSCLFFFYSLLFNFQNNGFLLIEGIIIIILGFLLFRYKKEPVTKLFQFNFPLIINNWKVITLLLGLLSVLILSILGFLKFSLANPHGYYDAFSIWNLHARMIFRGASHWTEGFSVSLYHADYPLLIPSSIARIWSLTKQETIRTPMVLSGIFIYGTAGLLAFSLIHFKKVFSAGLATIILLSTSSFLTTGSSQYADVPLSFFVLASGLCLFLFIRSQSSGYLFLTSLFAGLAAWTKNEGLLFIVIITFIAILSLFKLRNTLSLLKVSLPVFISGWLIPIFAVILFKSLLAPQNDLFIEQNLSIIIKNMTSIDRYVTIIKNLIYWIADTWQMPTLIAIMLFSLSCGLIKRNNTEKMAISHLLILVIAMVAGYCVIYLITPWDLVVHMRTSTNRLLLQIYPLVLFILFMVITPIEQ